MKMRRPIHSPRSGIVQEILVKEGETVEADNVLMALK
jgi:biotin carboxyl carrier protein